MEKQYDIGVLGLGVMGASLAKNMIRHGFRVMLYSVSEKERNAFCEPDGHYAIAQTLPEFVAQLKTPGKIFMMITAGKPVDSVVEQLLPLLASGDIIMDGGNSCYKDTKRRCERCEAAGVHFMGIGVSGGEEGALNGPSMMAGGSREGWEATKTILQTIAASNGGRTCCEYIAPDGAGHYVKMVHNGIEYAILELMAETYHFLRYGKEMEPHQIKETFTEWNSGKLNSYLTEISARVLDKTDEDGTLLLDRILDVAEQKGTGKWTVQEAVERGIYVPTIYEAQAIRGFSAQTASRRLGAQKLTGSPLEHSEVSVEEMEDALLLAIIISYSQGMELIAKASREENWNIDFAKLISVWKNGCIIRSRLLSEIEAAADIDEIPLLLSEEFSYAGGLEKSLRKVAAAAVSTGSMMPGFLSALQYYDAYKAEKLPLNFVQALRDCFGAHTYQRNDREGYFHSRW